MAKRRAAKLRWSFVIFFVPVLLWLLLLIVLPHLELLRLSFSGSDYHGKAGFTLENYGAFFSQPIYWLTFVRTALYSIVVTLIVALIALPVAFYITKIARLKASGFLMVLILVPFWVSELVRVYGWVILLRESGVINHFLLRIGILKQPVEMVQRSWYNPDLRSQNVLIPGIIALVMVVVAAMLTSTTIAREWETGTM